MLSINDNSSEIKCKPNPRAKSEIKENIREKNSTYNSQVLHMNKDNCEPPETKAP